MDNRIEIAETDNPNQGRIESQFPIRPELLEQARDLVKSSLTRFRSQREDWRVKNLLRDRAYRAILEPPRDTVNTQQVSFQEGRAYTGFDDKASPIVNDNCEAIKARLKESILPINKKYVDINSKALDPRIVDVRKEELNNQLEKNDIEKKLDVVVHNATVFGTFFIDVPFINDQDVVLTRQSVTSQRPILDNEGNPVIGSDGNPLIQTIQSLQMIQEIDIKYFGPGYEPVKDVEDVFLDMFIEDIQKQPIVIRRYIVDWDHLMDGVEKGIYFQDKVEKIRDKHRTSNREVNSRRERILKTGEVKNFADVNKAKALPREYELFKAYCDFAVEGIDNQNKKIIKTFKMVISLVDNEIIEMAPNRYFHQMIPMIKGTYRDLPGEAYGLGAIDTVLDQYRGYNDIMNQVADSRILALNPIKIIAARSASDKKDLNIFPGVEWTEKNPGDIRFAQFDFSVISNGERSLELLELSINKGMGVQRLMQGAGDQTDLDKTATGVTKVIEQADKKFRMIAKRIENAAIKEWAEMAYKVNVQFNPIANNGSFREVNSETNFVVKGVDNFFDNLEETNNLISFSQQASNLPGFNLFGFMKKIADNLGIELEEEKYGPMFLPPQPEQPEEKPLNVSVTLPIDMTKGTLPAMAGAQILAQKGIKLDLDAIGKAGEFITKTTDKQVKEESGILPQEMKRSVHEINTRKGRVKGLTSTRVSRT